MTKEKDVNNDVTKKPSYGELEAYGAELEKQCSRMRKNECGTNDKNNHCLTLSPLLRLTLDNIPDLIWAKDMDDRYIFANQAACDVLYKCERTQDVIGKDDLYFAERERSAGYEHTFGELCLDSDIVVKRTGKSGRFREFGKVRGEELVLDVTKTPIINADGVMVGTVGCARDITRAEKTEQALKSAATFIRDLSDEIVGVAVYGYNQDRVVTLWNKASETLFGYSKEEAIGKKLENLIIPADLKEHVVREHKRCLKLGEKMPSGELTLCNKQGDPVQVFSSHIVKETSCGIEIISVEFDVTPLKEAEEKRRALELQLQHAQKMEAVGALAGGIAHDFNNILGVVLGYADIGLEKCGNDPSCAEEFEQILVAGERAKKLVTQILDFSRQKEVDVVPVLPGLVVKEALGMLRSSLPATIEIESDIDMHSGYVLADPTQIHQLCMNLCTNAYQAMENMGGILRVTMKRVSGMMDKTSILPEMHSESYIKLSVSDNGPGMTREVKDKIFNPYFTTKSVGEGTGLGLSIVHSIVKSCKGFIDYDSNVGEGTVFNIYLPIMPEYEAEKIKEPKKVAIAEGDETILFVDDEVMLGEMAKAILERFGYTVVVINSADLACTLFARQHDDFHLVLTDFAMPGMNGLELAHKIRGVRHDIPVILCTGNSSRITEEMVRDAGVTEIVSKPFSGRALAVLIRKVLDERKKRILRC
ncbi:PAS domain-containing hybrid sensor histidine kinase/response regulator [Desulforhopalus sp. 52FAK]